MNKEDLIIQDVLAGDTDAFRGIIEQYQVGVFNLIARFIHDRSAAEDLTQDVFVAAFVKLSHYDAMRCKFSTWLWTIARNKSINYLRKTKRQPPRTTSCQSDADPSRAICREEFYQQLDRALSELPPHLKRVFVMAEFQQLSYEDIAQIECIRVGTVRSRIHRARKGLRALIEEDLS